MYRTFSQIDSLIESIVDLFPELATRVELPERSVEGRTIYALRLRGTKFSDQPRRGVLVVGGTHSRELMNPDAIIELAVDLAVSYVSGDDVAYGGRTWRADRIAFILDTMEIWLVPCSNPDGRHYAMTVDDMWRKNRANNAGTTCDGVDLNRNTDILWGVTVGATSCSPCADVYCGPDAFSEPETRNIKHLLDINDIVSFADVHSFSELILYPWGHAPTQTTDPTKRFTTLTSGTCTASIPASYQEYMEAQDVARFETVSGQIVEDIASVRGRNYEPRPSLGLYATTGTHGSYAYSRHIADPTKRKTYGFTFESGPRVESIPDSFHPPNPEPIKNDAKSGILSLLWQSICAIEFIGAPPFVQSAELSITLVSELRTIRDKYLATTASGRQWIALYERVQLPIVLIVISNKKLLGSVVKELENVAKRMKEGEPIFQKDTETMEILANIKEIVKDKNLRDEIDLIVDLVDLINDYPLDKIVNSMIRTSPKPKFKVTKRLT